MIDDTTPPLREISDEEIQRLATKLANWPSNGKPEMDDDVYVLKSHGFVEEREQMKNCRECGTRLVDWRYMKITPAGRLFLATARRGALL